MDIGDFSIDQKDLVLVGNQLIQEIGLVNHNIESANHLYKHGLSQIITQVFKIEKDIENKRHSTAEDKEIDRIKFEVQFTKVYTSNPTTLNYTVGTNNTINPITAHTEDKTYSAIIKVDTNIKATAYLHNGGTKVREEQLNKFKLCVIPVMVGSVLCNKNGKTREELIRLKEDPSDPGGYYIINGNEWVIDSVESVTYNQARIFLNSGHQREIVRCEFISKPGDTYQNSDYILIRILNNNQITFEIYRDQTKGLQIPFFLLFRLLGWNTDYEIIENIIYDMDKKRDFTIDMDQQLYRAFNVKYDKFPNAINTRDQLSVQKILIHAMPDQYKNYDFDTQPELYELAISKLMSHIDVHLLPHIGLDHTSRHTKARFLALLIRRMFMVQNGMIEPTDRDSYKYKRIHTDGTLYAKSFKTIFHISVVRQIRKAAAKVFKTTSFSQVNLKHLVQTGVQGSDFEKSIIQVIKSGNKSQIHIKTRQITNRLSSQQLDRHNQIAMYATLRQVTSIATISAKQSERANEMRRVHMSFLGYICLAHSSTGANVGINKQLALFTRIAPASSSEALKIVLEKDKDIILLEDISAPEIEAKKLSNVFINGYWIGVTIDSIGLVNKYRQLRRELKINPYTTIYWDNMSDEIWFWVDVGRLVRPLFIVYNSFDNPKLFKNNKNFRQGLAFNKKHVELLKQGKLSIDELLEQQVIEYISAEEQENLYICSRFDKLRRDQKEETKRYTHCDMPEALFGITAHTCPYAQHNAAPRVTFQTNQVKQSCGHYALNWAERTDKGSFIQYIADNPLIKTLANHYVFANGANSMVAIMNYSGFNQEDAIVMNKAAIDRGLFQGFKYDIYKTELDQKEEFGNPDSNTTTDIKGASYAKLENGKIKIGTVIEEGDAIIGKYYKLPKSDDSKFLYSDRSTIYKSNEPAIVHNVIVTRNEDHKSMQKVVIRKLREVIVGDKFSSRSGQKGITGILMNASDLPYTSSGITPDIIMNVASIPSRMTISQIYESFIGKLCAKKGTTFDGTTFRNVDINTISEELENYGLHPLGYERMYNGITGEFITSLVFMGPTYYQRLQKFVRDVVYSVSDGPTDSITNQPVDGGRASSGGLKIGEMESNVITSHGVSRFTSEKFRNHSDGYDLYLCRCGREAIVNKKNNIYRCIVCKDSSDIYKVPTTYSSKLFTQEIRSMNIGMKPTLKPAQFHKYE